jgi:NAD(P)-dependent dehydrogenase (short-subunit alcohol dehydrogenase family)
VLALSCEVRDQHSVSDLFTAIHKKFHGLDILINSAGIAHTFTPVSQLPPESGTISLPQRHCQNLRLP